MFSGAPPAYAPGPATTPPLITHALGAGNRGWSTCEPYRLGWRRPFVSRSRRIACIQWGLSTLAPTAGGCGHSEPWGLQWRQTTSPNSALARPRSPTATSVRPSGNAGNSQIMGRPETWKVRSPGYGLPQRLRDRRWPSLLLASWTSNGAKHRRRAAVFASPRVDENATPRLLAA